MPINDVLNRKLSGREYRRFDVSNLELRAAEGDDGSMAVEGYAATFNTPYELYSFNGYTIREQIDPGAFEACDMADVIMQYDHIGHVITRISNGTLSVKPDEHGLWIRAELSGTEIGRQLYQEIKGGYTTKMSMGFVVDEDERTYKEDHAAGTVEVLRTITKMRKLYDVSAVSIPANDTTEISARSAGDGVITQIVAECRERARQKLALRLRL